MTRYLDIPFESDPDALSELAFDYLKSVIINWQPMEGNLDVWILRATARIASEVQEIAGTVPTAIFRYAGANLFTLPPIDAVPANGTSTWTMRDNAGYTIPTGMLIGKRISGDILIPFQVTSDVIVPPGSTVTAAGAVAIEAINPGEEGNGLSGAFELIDSLAGVASIALVDITTGGIDAEEDDAYLNRLTLQLQLLAPRPIIPSDFAAMAMDVPGVYRALAIDGYDPVSDTYDNERMITLAAIDADGVAVSTQVKNDLKAMLEARREVNFVVNMINPTLNTIDVTYEVEAEPGFTDVADVESRVTAAIQDFLSPATWGLPGTGDQVAWNNDTVVRYLSLATTIKEVTGVWHVINLTLAIGGGLQDSLSVTMNGVAALPTPGNIIGTVDLAGSI
jgi:uncharacterized phage protein gp47/JayE